MAVTRDPESGELPSTAVTVEGCGTMRGGQGQLFLLLLLAVCLGADTAGWGA